MATQSFAELVNDVRLRTNGMTKNLADLSGGGIQQADADEGATILAQLETQDSEQEALKAALKAKSAELSVSVKQAKKWRSRMDKRIKIALEDDQEKWVEYGIKAKR